MWFFFAVIVVILWGGADVFYKLSSDESDKYSHLKIVTFVGLIMGIHAVIYIVALKIQYDIANIIYYLPVSFLYILSMTVGYVGLRYIELSIASPIGNSSGAVAFILCYIFLKERMNTLQFVSVAVIFLGILLLAFVHRKNEKDKIYISGDFDKYKKGIIAIAFPILYCVIDGLGTFADALILKDFMDEEQALISYEFTFFCVAIAALFFLTVIKKQKIVIAKQKEKIAAGLLETAGQFFYISAMYKNSMLTVPVVSCYSIASVLFSRIFLKEKLTIKQYIIIFIVIVAIGFLGIE